jgi:transcriptional regulator with XRE-family HTH domain
MSQPQGDRIRALLKKYGLTQTKAAEIVGVDPRTVRRWLAPEDAPTFNK